MKKIRKQQSRKRTNKERAFSLIEVVVALAIALLMLTALLGLQLQAAMLASRSSLGFETLPIAIEKLEDLSGKSVSGTSKELKGEYEIITSSREEMANLPITRIQVEVLYEDQVYSDLSLYKFRM